MIELDQRQIQLHAQPTGKADAIRQAGQILVASGHIEAGYIESMLGREKVANTYLGNGIAIPHGLPQDREMIKRTGIAVMQVPDGVAWNDGETVRLVVGIAAKSDEHIEVLRRLTRVLGDQEQVSRLAQTTDPGDIIAALTGERPVEPAKEIASDYASGFEAVIENKAGLHARPATFFVDLAKQFQSEIKVRRGTSVANGKSLISLLQLGVERGAAIRVSAEGADATAALSALQRAIGEGLGDADEEAPSATQLVSSLAWAPRSVGATITGISAAPGLAIGVVRHYTQRKLVVEDRPSDPMAEGDRFQEALNAANAELDTLYDEVKTRFGSGKAAIFRAHSEFLNDPGLIQQTVASIFQGHSAAWSWQQMIAERVAQMQKLDDPILAGRAVDLSDVGERVLRLMAGTGAPAAATPDAPVILLAEDLTPSDTAALDPDTILGFCTVKGGPTSHTAIIARSLGIPAIVGTGQALLDIPDQTPCILDGFGGNLYLKPHDDDIQAARVLQQELLRKQDAATATRFEPAVTSDGHQIEVAVNINRAADAGPAVEAGAEGVGLMRTEFLFLERTAIPSEDEQFAAYRDMVQAMQGRPVIIRTLDIGGDKEVPYLNLPKEDNSFLGIRGVRLCLQRPDLFIPQLRAIYRAAAYGPLKIMFPMIATLEDWRQVSALAEQIRQEINAPQVPLGIMIEVPSAAMLADQFAEEVDFFSIGTNDLTQYVLAMDRLHPQLARQADGLHPAVLRMIDQAVRAAVSAGKWIGVCGGVAGDPQGAVILAGLGVSELSVSTPSIAEIKAQIRSRSFADMQELAQQALRCRTAAEVRSL